MTGWIFEAAPSMQTLTSAGRALLTADLPLAADLALLLGLSFFLGLAYEDYFSNAPTRRPGGVRSFPILALLGGVLYLFDPTLLVPFTGGLVVLGGFLFLYYREHMLEKDDEGQQNVGLVAVLLNVYAYVLGAIAIALPHWAAVGTTVVVVLLFTSRERLHSLARTIEIKEFVTAAQFLILTGLVLPLLPAVPVTTLTSITPRQAWLALVVVCSLSYASYLLQRYVALKGGVLWMAALGGLYSSTATTIVISRQAKTQPGTTRQARAAITLTTGIMYLRMLAIVAIFNLSLARNLAPWLISLSVLAMVIAAVQFRLGREQQAVAEHVPVSRNPLELGAAAIFAILFVVISMLSKWVEAQFGTAGLYSFAAVVGITDIDPFVLNLAQGGAAGIPASAVAAAVLIAASSNNLLKAVYAGLFAGWRTTYPSVLALVGLALAGLAIAWHIGAAI